MSGPTFRGWIRKSGTGPTLTVTPDDLSSVGAEEYDSVLGFGWVRTATFKSSDYGAFVGLSASYGGHRWWQTGGLNYAGARVWDTIWGTDLQDGYTWVLPDDGLVAALDLCVVKRISEADSPWVDWYGEHTNSGTSYFVGNIHNHTPSVDPPNPENAIFWGLGSINVTNPTGTWTLDAHTNPPQTQEVFTSDTATWVNLDGAASVRTAVIIVKQPLVPDYLPYTVFSFEYQSSEDMGMLSSFAMGHQTYTPAPPPPSGGMPSLKLRKVAGGELPYFLHSKMLNGENQQTSA